MKDKTTKILAAITSPLTGIGILLSYLLLQLLPFSEVYVDKDRRYYAVFTLILFCFALLFFLLARRKAVKKGVKFIFYFLTFVFFAGFPLIYFIGEASSYRGFDYALETLGIGMLPALFFLLGIFILSGMRFFSIILSLVYGIFGVILLISLFKNLGRLGKAFSSVNTQDVLINAGFFLILAVFFYLNLRHALKK